MSPDVAALRAGDAPPVPLQLARQPPAIISAVRAKSHAESLDVYAGGRTQLKPAPSRCAAAVPAAAAPVDAAAAAAAAALALATEPAACERSARAHVLRQKASCEKMSMAH
jgi:hypothetical protein